MQQYICSIPNMESSGGTALAISHAIKRGIEYRLSILAKHGIADPRPDGWYPTQGMLHAIKEIADSVGEQSMLAMGREFVLRYELPPVKNLREALGLLPMMHLYSNRIGGKLLAEIPAEELPSDIGQFKVLEFDEQVRQAVAYTTSPFSVKNLEGCILGILERFSGSQQFSVKEDITKERQTQGGNSTTFLINW